MSVLPAATKKKKTADPKAPTAEPVGDVPAPPNGKFLVGDIDPNDWNFNKLSEAAKVKLRAGIAEVKRQTGRTVPIVIRHHPSNPGRYQIIDGEHRWNIAKEDGEDLIDAVVLDVNDQLAKILTSTLNYLRGEPDPDKHADYLARVLNDHGLTPSEAAEYLPETGDEITEIIEEYGLTVTHIEVPEDLDNDGEPEALSPREDFIELKFIVAKEQAVLIENEVARIAGLLKGKNLRGRALEMIAVNSSQTPVESINPPEEEPQPEEEIEEEEEGAPPPPPKKGKKLKDRLKAHAGEAS